MPPLDQRTKLTYLQPFRQYSLYKHFYAVAQAQSREIAGNSFWRYERGYMTAWKQERSVGLVPIIAWNPFSKGSFRIILIRNLAQFIS
jgi:hypothetical protein